MIRFLNDSRIVNFLSKKYQNYQLNNKDIDIYTSILPSDIFENNYNIFITSFEPEKYRSKNEQIINDDRFDLILTTHPELLEKDTRANFLPFGTTWISHEFKNDNKQFGVSFLMGYKKSSVGHIYRHNVWENQVSIKIPKKFLLSTQFVSEPYIPYIYNGNQFIKNNKYKNELFDVQFHIALENEFEDNWFSEKLIDCFYSKTVPIYVGCPNIGDFFNTNGMINCKDWEDIINKVNELKPDTYEKMKDAIEENYNRCLQYIQYNNNYEEKIIKIIEENIYDSDSCI